MRIELPYPMTPKSFPRKELVSAPECDISFTGIATDSGEVRAGDLFLAIRGERRDGSRFIPEALRHGAVLAVSESTEGERTVRCRSIHSLLFAMARARLCEVSPQTVAVTGSVGKSTFVAYAREILSRSFRVHSPNGNFNTDVGLPMTMLEMPCDTELLLLEMGARHYGDIARLSRLARPRIAVLTRIGCSHLEYFKDKAGVLRAKSEILLGMPLDGTLVYNADDPLLASWGKHLSVKALGVSRTVESTVSLLSSPDGTHRLHVGDTEAAGIRLAHLGEAAETAAVLSAAVASVLGIPCQEIAEALEVCHPPRMRQQMLECDGIRFIMDGYNASPESAEAALSLLAETSAAGRHIALLGDMLELGSDSAVLHRAIGRYAAAGALSQLYCLGAYAEEIARGAREGGMREDVIRVYPPEARSDLVRDLAYTLRTGDLLLLKASNALRMDLILTSLLKEIKI